MLRSLFVFWEPLPSHLPRASKTSERVLTMFYRTYEVSRLGYLTSLFTSTTWNIVTGVLFLVRRVLLPFSTHILASLRSFRNMLARLLVSVRLVPGMFHLAWRLIRVRLCFASARPIRLGIVQARAVVAFAVCGAFHELRSFHLNFV